MSVSKKRSADDVGFRDDGDAEMITDRKQRIKVSSPSKKAMQNSKFMQDKTSLYQQGMEELVEDSKKALEAATSPEEAVLISCEYSRLRQELKRCYNPKPGHLVAMGNDDCLQMGIAPSADADKETEYPPTFVNTVGSRVVDVAGGGLHSVALTVEGQVYTFGCNDDFALGRVDEDEDKMHLVSPIISGFKAVDHNQIIAVGAGDSHSLFLSIRGNVYQCGMYKDVDSGKFRDVAVSSASPKGNNKHPVMVSLPGPVVDIKAGASWNAALLEDGSLYTWGMGHYGQLARSKTMGAKIITNEQGQQVYDLGKMWIGEEYETDEIEQDSEGNNVLDDSGKPVFVMAYRYHEDLIKEKFLKPAPVCWADPRPKRSIISVACGELFLLVVAREHGYDSKVFSSGNNGYGQLGHGDTRERHELTSITALEGKLITKVAAGSTHALALDIVGTGVYAWGRADYGQVGHTDDIATGDIEKSPQQIAFPRSMEGTLIKDIATGPLVSMAITEENDVYTWGFVESGATGHILENDITRPKKLNVLKKVYGKRGSTNCHVLSASGGGQHTLMVIERFA